MNTWTLDSKFMDEFTSFESRQSLLKSIADYRLDTGNGWARVAKGVWRLEIMIGIRKSISRYVRLNIGLQGDIRKRE